MATLACSRATIALRFRVISTLRSSNCHYSVKQDHEEVTHFGFQEVKDSEKAGKVHNVFENVAKTYDVMNDCMSLGIHRVWKSYFVQKAKPHPDHKVVDVAGGTGDIAFRYLDYLSAKGNNASSADITVCDINQAMLDVGYERAKKNGTHKMIKWVQGDAEALPLPSNSADLYTIAFGIRNVTHIDKALQDAFRVLKRGGRFLCLEFSHVNNDLIREIYDAYSFNVIPVIGQAIAGDWNSYQYLVESIRQFPDQNAFSDMIRQAGFTEVTHENLSLGVVAIHSGFKL